MEDMRVELEMLKMMDEVEREQYFKEEAKRNTLSHIELLQELYNINREQRKLVYEIAVGVAKKYRADPSNAKASLWVAVMREAKLLLKSIDSNNTYIRKQTRELRQEPYGKKDSR